MFAEAPSEIGLVVEPTTPGNRIAAWLAVLVLKPNNTSAGAAPVNSPMVTLVGTSDVDSGFAVTA